MAVTAARSTSISIVTSNIQISHSTTANTTGRQLFNTPNTQQPHIHDEFVAEQGHGALDAGLAVRAHGVQERAADADAARAETEGLEDVGCAADAAVRVDFKG